ncbi:MAG: helix-turn-helix domain-containing protein [Opitutaceae bacterium]|jgi:AraC-like DNA-binding protein
MTGESRKPRSRELVEHLKRSQIYRHYERAFRDTTGMPLALRPPESFNLPHHDDPKKNPFCVIMAQTNHSCSACIQLQQELEKEAHSDPKTLRCFAGFCDSAVPVRVGDNVVAFLRTGQILTSEPSSQQFSETARTLLRYGAQVDLKRLEEAYFQSRVLTEKQYESIVGLLQVFAKHLSLLSSQLLTRNESAESPVIGRARSFIEAKHSEPLSLEEVARQVNISAYYFSRVFRKSIGMTFTEYLARLRVEKVKQLLLNPHKRVSEAAFEAGFQSLSQFNRVFLRLTGESPSAFRDKQVLASA